MSIYKMSISISDLLSQTHSNPDTLDHLTTSYKGVNIHIYGILHGISGGTNQEYRQLVNTTVVQSTGLKFGEKGMKSFYSGIEVELDDWNVLKLSDIIKLTLSIHGLPWRSLSFLTILLKERLTKTDKFKKQKLLNNLGGSPQFHLLDQEERRVLAGFPLSEEYLNINLQRRKGIDTFKLNPAFDPDWKWLNWIEPYANLPLRSIWMIEYALEYAKLNKITEISLFIGETHNTDIIHYLKNKETLLENTEIKTLVDKAIHTARLKVSRRFNIKKLVYIIGITLGMVIPAIYYLIVILAWLKYRT